MLLQEYDIASNKSSTGHNHDYSPTHVFIAVIPNLQHIYKV